MTAIQYPITDVIIETPRYSGASGVDGGEHDISGHGWTEIDGSAIKVAVHPGAERVFWSRRRNGRIRW
jgi:hypothetical protein